MDGRIGFIGLGIMGRPMARNLLGAGFELVVRSRSRGPVDGLVAAGAAAASSPAEVAATRPTRTLVSVCFTTTPNASKW